MARAAHKPQGAARAIGRRSAGVRRQPAAGSKTALQVAVLGGGLAGLTTSLELVRVGCHVDLYEAGERLGGKAGSDAKPLVLDARCKPVSRPTLPVGYQSDHGYHVFPKWYTNMRALWPRIGLDPVTQVYEGQAYRLVPPAIAGKHQPMVPEARPSLTTLLGIWELAIQEDRYVGSTTLQAFLHGLDYHDSDRPLSFNDYVLNALTIGDLDLSSRVVRNVFRQWLPVFAQPNWDALKGSLQQVLIDPLEAAVHAAAKAPGGGRFRVHMGASVEQLGLDDNGMTVAVRSNGRRRALRNQQVVLALPPDVLRTLYDDELQARMPELGELHYLRANPFGAIDVIFKGRLQHFTEPEHFTLGVPAGHREHGITGFDISRHWPGLDQGKQTVLQFVVADSRCFNGLSEEAFSSRVVREIAHAIPEVLDPKQVQYLVPHSNQRVPLFVNDVDTWRRRPEPRASLAGVYFAGDYTRHDTDVTSMEGAVRSGLNAAEALRQDLLPAAAAVAIAPPVAMDPQVLGLASLGQAEPTLMRGALLEQIKAMAPAAVVKAPAASEQAPAASEQAPAP